MDQNVSRNNFIKFLSSICLCDRLFSKIHLTKTANIVKSSRVTRFATVERSDKNAKENFCATIKKPKLNHKEQILCWKININNGFYINFIRDLIKILCLPVFHSLQREFLEKTKW